AVLGKLSGEPITEAKLMGLGEPFLCPDFPQVCKRFKEEFPKAFVISATNCQYKLGDTFKKALPYIDLLYLSVDGYKENYEIDRKGATWDRLITFLDDLKGVDTGRTRIAVNYVVTDKNYKDIEKINKLVNEKYKYVEEVRLNIAQWWGEDEDIKFDFSDDFYSTLERYRKNVKGKSPWTYSDCFWPKKGFYMDVNGDVKICCLNTSTEPIGNIFKSSLDEILLAPKRLQVATECALDRPGKHCLKCDYKKLSPTLKKILRPGAGENK
ncbi:MAG: SPASM domain-containing protein, partial [Candidatus Margulisiibacteriota bacterium]